MLLGDVTEHREYPAVMLFVVPVSRQNSAHHDAEYVPLHLVGPAQELRQNFGELRKTYSSSWCYLHNANLGSTSSCLQSSIKGDKRARLLAGTDDEIGIIGVNLMLFDDKHSIIKWNIKKTNGYLLIFK
ncbi:hypothetical protein SE17_06055 [Kouleothrix aurantiaca]|uniref:Uncharacterized protein n=1 Tax=Kouleothrix aurantiaca TaxID=186479 RepID=A0A0P9D852_9CHLR|nr:hypothetical protein SE17_06055 [Kouleothrix aurantiaca]